MSFRFENNSNKSKNTQKKRKKLDEKIEIKTVFFAIFGLCQFWLENQKKLARIENKNERKNEKTKTNRK